MEAPAQTTATRFHQTSIDLPNPTSHRTKPAFLLSLSLRLRTFILKSHPPWQIPHPLDVSIPTRQRIAHPRLLHPPPAPGGDQDAQRRRPIPAAAGADQDLCLRQREEIRTLKDAVLFLDADPELEPDRRLRDEISTLTDQIQCLAQELAQVRSLSQSRRVFFAFAPRRSISNAPRA
jgi:hypothetical protein